MLAVPRVRRPVIALVLVALAVAAAVLISELGPSAPPWQRVRVLLAVRSNRVMPVILEDDKATLFSPPPQRRAFFATLRGLGVGIVRISSDWSVQAPGGDSPQRPRHFDARDPRSYPPAKIAALDAAVRAASAAGITVDLDLGFYAPRWATRAPRGMSGGAADPFHTDVNAADFAAYAQMLATRYDGHFRLSGAAVPLPRVGLFEIWNEPNLRWDFGPQRIDGRPESPTLYRELVTAALPAIHRVDPRAIVLIANTSSTGGSAGVAPLAFIRALACVNARLVPIHTGACAHFHTLGGDGVAHHPYSYDQAPWVRSSDPQAARIGDLDRLQHLLDQLAAMGRITPADAHLWLTEEGYQSNAQLADSRWNEAQQAQFLAISAYETWSDPQAVSFSQFLLRDTLVQEALAARRARGPAARTPTGTWSTGLEREDGRPKPALAMLRAPVVARPVPTVGSCRAIEVWAHLGPDTQGARSATVVFSAAGGAGPSAVARSRTGPDGVLDVVLRYRGPQPTGVRVRFGPGPGALSTPTAQVRGLGDQPRPAGIPARVSCG